MTVQAVLFDKHIYSTSEARKWLKKHKLVPIKMVHEVKNYYRYRIEDPSIFRQFRIIKIHTGIELVLGFN